MVTSTVKDSKRPRRLLKLAVFLSDRKGKMADAKVKRFLFGMSRVCKECHLLL